MTIPITASMAEINQEIKKWIEDGTCNIIIPKEFSRLTDGTLSTETFFIECHRIPHAANCL